MEVLGEQMWEQTRVSLIVSTIKIKKKLKHKVLCDIIRDSNSLISFFTQVTPFVHGKAQAANPEPITKMPFSW